MFLESIHTQAACEDSIPTHKKSIPIPQNISVLENCKGVSFQGPQPLVNNRSFHLITQVLCL